MPFERYLRPPSDQAEPDLRRDVHQSASYPDYTLNTGRIDPLGFDTSIFTSNVQFQMPQLMLGPTVAPGGGAEALPAGIVGHSNAMASTWLANPGLPRYGENYAVHCRDSAPVPHQIQFAGYYQPQIQEQPSTESSRHNSVVAASNSISPVSSTVSSSSNGQGAFCPTAARLPPSISLSMPMSIPSVSGLPVYSTSGFDLLSILARVAIRPNPKIALGPVDMTCSFAVVDTRRFDHPIVYASPTFYKLTGYCEEEVIGRNCRFLQAPGGNIERGELRRHTAPEAVSHLRKSLIADKECQVSLINYRKNGCAFINLVTVIPIPGGVHNTPEEADEVAYHVGFQVDLTEQPNAILQKLRDGSYMVNYSNNVAYPAPSSSKDWKSNPSSMVGISKQLRTLLIDQDFVRSIPLSISTTTLSLASADRNERNDPYDGNRLLSLMLLESSPDFVQVLSLKGAFLYVAPSVRRVLGYEPEELAGRSITDFCHPADTVPLMRELKESSTTALMLSEGGASSGTPKVVDLLFRMQAKNGEHVWIESRGRLYVEPGKGRKAIVLSGRARSMPSVQWGPIARAGGLRPSVSRSAAVAAGSAPLSGAHTTAELEQEFWALLSSSGSFLFASAAVKDVLGWGAGEVIGRALGDLINDAAGKRLAEETLAHTFADSGMETRKVTSYMKHKDGSLVLVSVVFYHPPGSDSRLPQSAAQRRPLVCQITLYDETSPTTVPMMSHPLADQLFEELDISRGSSWQYELQQLKFANQSLKDEIEELEGKVGAITPSRREYDNLQPQHSFDTSSWSSHHGYGMTDQNHLSLKRSWDGTVIGGRGGAT